MSDPAGFAEFNIPPHLREPDPVLHTLPQTVFDQEASSGLLRRNRYKPAVIGRLVIDVIDSSLDVHAGSTPGMRFPATMYEPETGCLTVSLPNLLTAARVRMAVDSGMPVAVEGSNPEDDVVAMVPAVIDNARPTSIRRWHRGPTLLLGQPLERAKDVLTEDQTTLGQHMSAVLAEGILTAAEWQRLGVKGVQREKETAMAAHRKWLGAKALLAYSPLILLSIVVPLSLPLWVWFGQDVVDGVQARIRAKTNEWKTGIDLRADWRYQRRAHR